jgi:hypothetical protein
LQRIILLAVYFHSFHFPFYLFLLRGIHYVNNLYDRNFDEEGGLPRFIGDEYYFRSHADVAISLAMGEIATASATAIAKVTLYYYC